MNKLYKLITNPLYFAGIIVFIVLAITGQKYFLGSNDFHVKDLAYTHYNNYLIFKQSFFHLIHHKDLYQLYPLEHFDYYKYSPSFALLMAPMAVLPDLAGLFIWNLLNASVLLFALVKLPVWNPKYKYFLLIFVLIELITSLQNSQSNGLIAGLLVFAFIFLERRNIAIASLFIVLTVFIKLFGIVALALFIFYPNKWKSVLYTIGWFVLLALLPLVVCNVQELITQYKSWFYLLANDHTASIGFSVAGWLKTWFNINVKDSITIIGGVLLLIPLLKYKYYNQLQFRLLFLASVLIWVVIFNHKAESPTFIIAVTGIVIWFSCQKLKTENLILLIIAFIFTTLSSTDLFPRSIRTEYMYPYVVKAVPSILIWIKIITEMLIYKVDDLVTI